jgi:hypothetical protein
MEDLAEIHRAGIPEFKWKAPQAIGKLETFESGTN